MTVTFRNRPDSSAQRLVAVEWPTGAPLPRAGEFVEIGGDIYGRVRRVRWRLYRTDGATVSVYAEIDLR